MTATSAWDTYVALLEPDLDAVWIRNYGANLDVHRLAVDSQGNLVVTGLVHGYADLGNGSIGDGTLRGFVAKLDPDGDPIWSEALGAVPLYSGIISLALAADDSIWVATPFSGALQAGSSLLVSAGDYDLAVVRYSPGGAALTARRFGGSGFELPFDSAIDSQGHLIVGGTFNSTISAGGCDVTAKSCAMEAGCTDAFLLKLRPSGEPMWLHAFGDDQDQSHDNWMGETFVGIDVGPGDSIVTTGWFSGTVDFSGGTSPPLIAAGDYDLFAARFAP
jgi:hypothetical protein